MRRGVACDPVAGSIQPVFVGGDAGALAIGPGNGNHLLRNSAQAEALGNPANTIQTQFDGLVMQVHLPFQPLVERFKTHRGVDGIETDRI